MQVSSLKAKGQKRRRVETPLMSGEVMGESESGRKRSWDGGIVTCEQIFVSRLRVSTGTLLLPADYLDHFPPIVQPLWLLEDRWTDVLVTQLKWGGEIGEGAT